MDASSAQVPVPNSRKKFLYFSIVVIVTITTATLCILIYDKIKEQDLFTGENHKTVGQTLAKLSSNETQGSVTAGPSTESTIPSSLSTVKYTPVFFETFVSTSVKHTTKETTASHVSPLTSGVTFSTPVETDSFLSTERTPLVDTSTCQQNVSNTTTNESYPLGCSGFHIDVGLNEIHTLYLHGSANKTAHVNCVSSSDGIWTVIQRRFDGSVDFYRNWNDYKEGFGDAAGEYWLGNDAIHQLTSRSRYKLKIVLMDWDNVTAYAVYDSFQISDESDSYRLSVGGYHGDAGDSLSQHNGLMFSTLDHDNDLSGGSCAGIYTGAWWYHACYDSHLNGYYFDSSCAFNVCRIVWATFRPSLPLKETTMMIQEN